MPYHFDFDPTNQIARCRFTGQIKDDELKECYRKMAEFVALSDPRGTVTDFSGATSLQVSRETVLELARLPPALPDPQRVRVIVAPSPLTFGMSRMFEMEGERTRPSLHVVRSEQEAWAILGVWNPRFEPYKK